MSKRKAILISNPKTGRYAWRQLPAIEAICKQFRELGLEVETAVTTGPGEATRIAARAAGDGFGDVIISGGDGTINEALQGLIGKEARLGVLPRGTGNLLARELDLPLDCKQAVQVIARGRSRRIYVGCVIDATTGAKRFFLLMAGIGLDASLVQRVHPGLKRRFGEAAFWYSGLSHLTNWRPIPFDIEVNGEHYTATFATVGKAARYGGGLAVTPRARLDQPEFEICLVDSHSRLRYLHLLSYAMRGGVPPDKTGVRFLYATNACANGSAPVQVDGELIGQLPMNVEIAPHSIEVIVP